MPRQKAEGYYQIKEALPLYEKGCTAQEMADALGCNYYAARRYLEGLCNTDYAQRLPHRVNGNIVYISAYKGNAPALPTLNAGAPVPLSRLISANIKDPNELIGVKLLKRFPLYLAQMARLASLTRSSDSAERPTPDDWNVVRDQISELATRSALTVKHCQMLLDNRKLWHSKYAFEAWFGDPQVPFTPEQAVAYYQQINALLEGH